MIYLVYIEAIRWLKCGCSLMAEHDFSPPAKAMRD